MSAQTDLGWIANSLLKGSGWGCALRIEAHFDESGTDHQQITVAGYLFDAGRIDQFAAEWDTLLKQNDIPFLHMVDFAPGNAPFDRIENRTRVQMQFMRLIKHYSINGIVCNITNTKDNMGKAYHEAARGAVKATLEWADKASYDGKIAYFFEAGATGQGLVEGEFLQIARDPASAATHRYAGHAFLPKVGNPGVQAADFLAWQYHNFTKKRAKKNLARLDMRALLRHPHHISDLCGDPPRESSVQSVGESILRVETVYYLPRAKSSEDCAIFRLGEDIVLFSGTDYKNVLACPNCYRAMCEDFTISSFHRFMKTENNFVIKCWCKTECLVPKVMVPFAH